MELIKRNKGSIKQPEINKMTGVSSYLSVITLNINGLNASIKRHRVAEGIFFFLKIQLYAAHKKLTSPVRTHINEK